MAREVKSAKGLWNPSIFAWFVGAHRVSVISYNINNSVKDNNTAVLKVLRNLTDYEDIRFVWHASKGGAGIQKREKTWYHCDSDTKLWTFLDREEILHDTSNDHVNDEERKDTESENGSALTIEEVPSEL